MPIKNKPDVSDPVCSTAPVPGKPKNKAKTPAKKAIWTYPEVGTNQVSTYWAGKIKKDDMALAVAQSNPLIGSHAQLRDLVVQIIENAPLIYDKKAWASCSIANYADALHISERHAHRVIAAIPLRKLTIRIEGKKTTLLRWGGEQQLATDDLARIMRAIWVKSGKPEPTPQQYGLLLGLARDWPYPYAPDLFKTVIDNWSVFMGGVKLHIDMAKEGGDFYEDNPGKYYQRYLRYPSISVIRRFWPVAAAAYTIVAGDQDLVPKPIQKVMMSI